jgi:hypothetical protein
LRASVEPEDGFLDLLTATNREAPVDADAPEPGFSRGVAWAELAYP